MLINSACDVVSPTILETRFAASDDRKMNIKKFYYCIAITSDKTIPGSPIQTFNLRDTLNNDNKYLPTNQVQLSYLI